MSTPEGALLRLTLDYLQARHVLAYRMQSAFTVAEYKGKKRAWRSGVLGMADILAFKDSYAGNCIPVWLEIKTAKGKQSDLQRTFQLQVESRSHLYVIVRSLEDVEAIL